MAEELPAAKFERFERVRVVSEPRHSPELRGRVGTILWRESYSLKVARPHMPSSSGWLYLIFFVPENAYRTLFEQELQSEGAFDPETAHRGTSPEFSFDIIMEEDMTWVEGTYRLPGRFWEVMIFRKRDVAELRLRLDQQWPSGITGTVF